jgi:hypothetical protein
MTLGRTGECTGCLKESFTIIFKMLMCGECYEKTRVFQRELYNYIKNATV